MDKKIHEPFKVTPATILLLILFIALSILVLLPFYAVFLASLKPGKEVMRQGLNLGLDTTIMSFKNYLFLFSGQTSYPIWFKNSFIITIVQTVLTLLASACVGYGFAMYNFRLKNALFPYSQRFIPLFERRIQSSY